jgi:hypothetical protein
VNNQVPVQGASADQLRKMLDRKFNISLQEKTVKDVLQWLQTEVKGLHIQASVKSGALSEKITANLTDIPLGAILQLIEDALTEHRFVVREYGLLIVPENKVPSGAMLLTTFWKSSKSEQSKSSTKTK